MLLLCCPAAIFLCVVCSAVHAAPFVALSTRGDVGTGHKALVTEFIITGSEPKLVLLRAIGPGLGSPTALKDPVLEIRNASGDPLAGLENDNWKTRTNGTSQQAEIESTGAAPTHDLDAAIIAYLSPGSYTAVVRGKGSAGGVAVCDLFDVNDQPGSSIPAVGSRVDLETISGPATAHFGFRLTEQRSVVVRVLGPSLGEGSNAIDGTVADPELAEITDENGNLVPGSHSDDWKTQGGSSGTALEPSHDAESAVLLQNLPAGSYDVRVTGNNADGIVFIQAYALPYNTPLNPAPEIGEPYGPSNLTCASPPSGLAVWFRGDGSGNDFQGGNSGHLEGNANAEAPAKVGTGFGMDGNGDYVEVSNEQAIKPQHLTVNAWVKFDSLESTQINAPAGHQYLVTKHNSRQNGSGFEEAYALVKLRSGGQDVFNFVLTTADKTRVGINSTTAIQAGQFYHVAGTFDGQTARLYVNGVLEASAPANLTLDYSSRSLYLGSSGIPFFDGYFNGVLDEVQIYNRALSEAEIQSIVDAGSAGVCKVTPGFWVAGRDLEANETPDNPAETNAQNTVVPEWSYGTRAQAATTELNLFRPELHVNGSNGFEGWSSSGAAEGVLGVNATSTPIDPGANASQVFPQQLFLHPSSSNAFVVARWTAPAAGYYRVMAEWLDLDANGGNGASAHVVVNGTEVFGRIVPADQFGPKRFVGQEWDDGGNAEMPADTFKLNAGDVVDFALGSRGDASFDSTTFNALVRRVAGVEITNAPPQSRTEEGVPLPEGADVTLEVNIDSVVPVTGVTLRVNGRETGITDTTAPYSLTATNLQPGYYSLDVVATDVENVESRSEPINVHVKAIPTAARTDAEGSKESSQKAAAASSERRTYTCTQSGGWENPATWGGEGVPGRNDYAVIPSAFAVNALDVEVDDLTLFGSLVIGSPGAPRRFVVYDKFYAGGTVEGGDSSSQLIVFNRLDCLTGAARFRGLSLFVSGETIVTNGGAVDASDSVLVLNGRMNLSAAPGTNRPTVVRADRAQIEGALVLDEWSQFIARDGLISDHGAALIGNDSAGLIGNDSAGILSQNGINLIGTDGASILGVRGQPLIGTDGATLIGTDGATLIGTDGATLIGDRGGSFGPGSSYSRKGSSGTVTQRAASEPGIVIEGGTIGGKINLIGNVVNRGGFISPGNSAGSVRVEGDYTQEAAGTLLLEIGGTQPEQSDQLQIDGTANLGGKLIVKTINGFTPQEGDTFSPINYKTANRSFDSISSNANVSFGPNGIAIQINGPNPPAPKALNIATRMRVETGDNVLIAGFIITGDQPKRVLVRGIGPTLPVADALADTTLDLDAGAFFNDDWKSDQEQEIRDTTIPPLSELESAIVATLDPGAHTAVLRGFENLTGVGLVEVYDLETGSPVQLANISTRGQVQTGDNVMIGGFIIAGDYPAKVLLRAIGPSLPVEGALQDPTLELVDSNGASIKNDNWPETQKREIFATTVAPTNSKEAAIVATLVPGAYTAIVRGKDDTIGVALVEGYNLQ